MSARDPGAGWEWAAGDTDDVAWETAPADDEEDNEEEEDEGLGRVECRIHAALIFGISLP